MYVNIEYENAFNIMFRNGLLLSMCLNEIYLENSLLKKCENLSVSIN